MNHAPDQHLDRAADFEIETALTWLDRRTDYGEGRRIAPGCLGMSIMAHFPGCTTM